jgi:uncharacterized membrane protein YdjX (TVP38/TMEM64 family)
MKARHKAAALALLLIGAAAAAELLGLRAWLPMVLAWIGAHRALAWAAFVAGYVLGTIALVPGTLLTLGAGFLFGLPLGIALVSAGSVLGASCAFLIGRVLARGWVSAKIGALPRFSALDRATRHSGFLVVFLVRLSPLFPFNLTNYALGLTAVSFRDYFFASWIGMLPATVIYVYIGTLAKSLAELGRPAASGGGPERVLLLLGFAATAALAVLIARRATRALNTRLTAEDGGRRR